MPIVEVELVSDAEADPGLASALADQIGRAMGAREGSTWVRLRVLRRDHYGEDGGPLDQAIRPVFVTVTAAHRPAQEELAAAVDRITSSVARVTGHPLQNVHVIFTPDGAGRIAFGGHLVE